MTRRVKGVLTRKIVKRHVRRFRAGLSDCCRTFAWTSLLFSASPVLNPRSLYAKYRVSFDILAHRIRRSVSVLNPLKGPPSEKSGRKPELTATLVEAKEIIESSRRR